MIKIKNKIVAMNLQKLMQDERLMRALIGMGEREFLALLEKFAPLVEKTAYKRNRKRKPGAGRKHTLRTPEQKLFYILFYIKCYPTYDVAAFFLGVNRAQTKRWVDAFRVPLEKALGKSWVLPERKISSVEEFLRRFPKVKELIIDGTERPVQRPKDKKKQRERYSGKKKRHTQKNLVGVSSSKKILFLGKTHEGREHDYAILKKSRLAEVLPKDVSVFVDLGFKGLEKHSSLKLYIPFRKPRTRELTIEQKEFNKEVRRLRVIGEHAIGGVKRFRCITDVSRNRDENMKDHLMWLACGLWNFHLKIA